MRHLSQKQRSTFFLIVYLVIGVMAVPAFIHAQDTSTPTATPQGAPIEISGAVGQISGGTITVSGLTVDVSGLSLNVTLTPGTVVTVSGYMLPTNIIVAQTVVINIVTATPTPAAIDTAEPEETAEATEAVTPAMTQTATPSGTLTVTPAVTASPTPSSNVIIVIEGPVVNINVNIITIYDFDIEVDPHHPILNLIQIGDIVRIEGAYGAGNIVVATVVSNLSDMNLVSGATASLEGPVESINGNVIVVNGIAVQLADNDPLLQTVTVGQYVSVQGNFQNNNGTFVLVVVTIIVNTNTVEVQNNCYWKESGMSGMGKWRCDDKGMGMGMGKKDKKEKDD